MLNITMDIMFSFIVFSAMLQLVRLQNPTTNETSIQATVEIVSGHSKVFTGDTVRLRCTVPATPYKSTWSYKWYNGPKLLPHFGQDLVLWNIKTKSNGKYYCQGYRDTSVRDIPTFQSLPAEISVDGGWAILDAPSKGVVGFPVSMTCRVRGNPPIHDAVLYRDGTEVLRQNGPLFFLTNMTLENWGQYTCRASWDVSLRTHSVISTEVSVLVVEPLTQPTLTVVDNEELRSLTMIKLVCLLDYNVPAPAPPVLYYFYNNDNRLGPPTSENFSLVRRTRGKFSCNAKVPKLGLSKWSDPESY